MIFRLISDEKRELVFLVIYSAGYVGFLELVGERLISVQYAVFSVHCSEKLWGFLSDFSESVRKIGQQES